MATAERPGYVAECFWPGVRQDDLIALVQQIGVAAGELARQGGLVRYLGSMLVVDDEVVLCLFEGQPEAVRHAMQQAGISSERILRSIRVPWPEST